MKANTELHGLIRSMNMNEKRHFHLLSTRHSKEGGHGYMKLFRQIAASEVYDEDALKAGLDHAAKSRFATEKNYLHGHVIDCLNHYHRNRPSLKVYSLMVSIEVLYEKKLFGAALKQIRKGKEQSMRLEKIYHALSFLRWEASLLAIEGRQKEMDEAIDQERHLVRCAEVQAAIMQMAFRMKSWADKGTTITGKIRQLKNAMSRIIQRATKNKHNTFLSHYYYHSAMSLFAGLSQDQELRIRHYNLIHEWMHERPWLIDDLPNIYNGNISNVVNALISLQRFDEAREWIRLQRSFMKTRGLKNEAMSARIFLNSYESELLICAMLQQYNQGKELAKSVESGMRKFGSFYQGEQYGMFLSLAALLYGAKDKKLAAKWLNRITAYKTKTNVRADIAVTARLLLLIILLENKDSLFTSRRRATERWLAGQDVFFSAHVFLRFLKILHDRQKKVQRDFLLQETAAEFSRMQKEATARLPNSYFDFNTWMKKQME